MSLKKRASKSVSIALAVVILGCSIPNNIYASDKSSNKMIEIYNMVLGKASE